ncbi:MAG: hypothetical protein AB1331_08390 [Bacillota bacterium]
MHPSDKGGITVLSMSQVERELADRLLEAPQIPVPEVPDGATDQDNLMLRHSRRLNIPVF